MLRLAGSLADGCIINWLSAEDAEIRRRRTGGRHKRERSKLQEISARILFVLDPPSPEAELGVRRHINFYLNVPVYREFQNGWGAPKCLP
jgi:hypothetical protein